jgi:pyruvate dehydrogenase E1 component
VVEVKYGRRLQAAYERPGGGLLRDWIDLMPNEQYQSLFGLAGDALRKQFLDGAPDGVAELVAEVPDGELAELVTDLGGHDLSALLQAYRQCDEVRDRPSVVFAYTVKGWGLPIAGNPRNHSALLSGEQVDGLRSSLGLTQQDEWDRFDPASPAGVWCNVRREALARPPRSPSLPVAVPETTPWPGTSSRPRRTSPRRPTSPASSTRPACSPRRSDGRGTRTGCCAGPRDRPGSTSSWASAR